MKRLVIAAVLLVAAILLLASMYRGFLSPRVTIQTGGFAEDRFLLLLFPLGDENPVKRAVIVNLAECRQESVEVYLDGLAVAMAGSGFTAVPPQNYGVFVERLNQELAGWEAASDWSLVEYAFTPAAGGGRAVLAIRDRSGTTLVYTYLVEGRTIRPLEIKTEVNLPKKMSQ